MKTRQKSILGAVLAIFSASGFAISPVSAQSPQGKPLSVEASLVTPSRITLGEPILLRYKIANDSGLKVAAHLGLYGTDWYTLTLNDAYGPGAYSVPDPRPAHPQGAHSTQNGFINLGVPSTDYIPVTKRLFIQRPGKYILTLHVSIPYLLDETSNEAVPDESIMASGLKQTQDITFFITVLPADPAHLRATAGVLRVAAVNGQDGPLARASMDLLFAMPEAQATTNWRLLALKPSASSDLVASELIDLHSATALEILAEMLNVPNLECSPISDRLNHLYNVANPVLREQIKAVARRRGFEMPQVASAPVIWPVPAPNSGGTRF